MLIAGMAIRRGIPISNPEVFDRYPHKGEATPVTYRSMRT